VFGRTLKRNVGGGRNHNQNHHVMTLFGKHVKGGVIAASTSWTTINGAVAIDSKTGKGGDGGDIDPLTHWNQPENAGGRPTAAGRRHRQRIAAGKVVSAAIV